MSVFREAVTKTCWISFFDSYTCTSVVTDNTELRYFNYPQVTLQNQKLLFNLLKRTDTVPQILSLR